GIQFDPKWSRVTVVTDDIQLEGIPLGPFKIKLDWSRLGDSQPYEVIAVEANPASSSDDVTHPHVQDNRLCEGDGRQALQKALAQGRLFDFFVLVRQILTTYNPSSAY